MMPCMALASRAYLPGSKVVSKVFSVMMYEGRSLNSTTVACGFSVAAAAAKGCRPSQAWKYTQAQGVADKSA